MKFIYILSGVFRERRQVRFTAIKAAFHSNAQLSHFCTINVTYGRKKKARREKDILLISSLPQQTAVLSHTKQRGEKNFSLCAATDGKGTRTEKLISFFFVIKGGEKRYLIKFPLEHFRLPEPARCFSVIFHQFRF